MENVSYDDFWMEFIKTDNGTLMLDESKFVSKLRGFRIIPRTIGNVLAAVILATNSGSLLAIGWRDRRTRFTSNLRIVTSLSCSNLLIGVCVLVANADLVPVVESNGEACAFVVLKALMDIGHMM